MSDFEAVVIGSGFGGAVAACRMAQAGLRVLVLERGRRWRRQEYPSISKSDWIWNEQNPARENGWFDVRLFGSIGTVAGAGVGGGSLHYANVSIDAEEDLFDEGWPPEIVYRELKDKYYPQVSAMLRPETIPRSQYSNRTKLMQEAAEKSGFGDRFREVELAIKFKREGYTYDASREPDPDETEFAPNDHGVEQGHCVHLGQCVLGCPVDARNTLALNYIPAAEQAGAEVRPLHVVRYIDPTEDGYRIHFDRIADGRLTRGIVTGRIVVVSAGSIGSTELLLRSKHERRTLPHISSRLGHQWSSNANYLTLAAHPGDVFPTRGPTISSAIDFLGEEARNGSDFFIEDGGLPDLFDEFKDSMGSPAGEAKRFRSELLQIHGNLQKQPLRKVMLWFAQGRDRPVGRLKLERFFFGLFGPHVFRLDWDRNGARDVLDAIQEIHRKLAGVTGGDIFFQPRDALITPHPLGGCPMGRSAEDGVVDHRGEVFGYPNLYVADGSIMPRSVGHNPSKTIAALSERIAEQIVKQNG